MSTVAGESSIILRLNSIGNLHDVPLWSQIFQHFIDIIETIISKVGSACKSKLARLQEAMIEENRFPVVKFSRRKEVHKTIHHPQQKAH